MQQPVIERSHGKRGKRFDQLMDPSYRWIGKCECGCGLPVLKTGEALPRRYKPPRSPAGMVVGLLPGPSALFLARIYLNFRPSIDALEAWIAGAFIVTTTIASIALIQRHFDKIAEEKLIHKLENKRRNTSTR